MLHHMNWVIEEIDLKIDEIERNSSEPILKRRIRRKRRERKERREDLPLPLPEEGDNHLST